jgi:hypothetical protein
MVDRPRIIARDRSPPQAPLSQAIRAPSVNPAATACDVASDRRQRMGSHAVILWVLCCAHGVIRFQHRPKISSILIRDTVAPIAIRTTSGSCSLRDVKSSKPGAVMSIIPLDLQRRCERRWAARFSRPIPSAASRNQRPVRESLEIAAPAKSKEKPVGLKRQASPTA